MQDESYDRSDRSRSASSRPLSRDGCFDAVMSSPISAVGAVVVVVVAAALELNDARADADSFP